MLLEPALSRGVGGGFVDVSQDQAAEDGHGDRPPALCLWRCGGNALPFVPSLWCLTGSSSVRKSLITTLSLPTVTTSTTLGHLLWLSPIHFGLWEPLRIG